MDGGKSSVNYQDASHGKSRDVHQGLLNSDSDLQGAQRSPGSNSCSHSQSLQSTTSSHHVNGEHKLSSEHNAEVCELKNLLTQKETTCDNSEAREKKDKNCAEDEPLHDFVTDCNFKSGFIKVNASSTLKLKSTGLCQSSKFSRDSFNGILDINTVASLLPAERTSTEESAIEHILSLEAGQAQLNNQSPPLEDGSVFNLEQDSGVFDLSLNQQDFDAFEGRDGPRDWPVRTSNHSIKQLRSSLQRCKSSGSKPTDDSKICWIKKQIDQEISSISSSSPDTFPCSSSEATIESKPVRQQSVHEAKLFFEKQAAKDLSDEFPNNLICEHQHNHNPCDDFQQPDSMGKKSQSLSKGKLAHVVYSKEEFSEEYASPQRSKSWDKTKAGGESSKKDKKKSKEKKRILSDPSQSGSLKVVISAPITTSEVDTVTSKRHTIGAVPRTPTMEASTDTSELLADVETVTIHQDFRQPDANPNKSNNNQEQHKVKKRLSHSRNGGISPEGLAAFGKHPLIPNLESSPEVIRDTLSKASTSQERGPPPPPPKPKRLSLTSQLQKQNDTSNGISTSQDSQQSLSLKEDPVHERKTEIAVERQVLLKQAVKSKPPDLTGEETTNGTPPENPKSPNSYTVITRYIDGEEELILGALPLQKDKPKKSQKPEPPRRRREKPPVPAGRKFRHYACIEPVGKPVELITSEQRWEDTTFHSFFTSPGSNTFELDVSVTQSKDSNETPPIAEKPTNDQALPASPVILQSFGSISPESLTVSPESLTISPVGLDISPNGPDIPPKGLNVPPKGPNVPPRGPNVPPKGPNIVSSRGADISPKGSDNSLRGPDIFPKSPDLSSNITPKGSNISLTVPNISPEGPDIPPKGLGITLRSPDVAPKGPDISQKGSDYSPKGLVISPKGSGISPKGPEISPKGPEISPEGFNGISPKGSDISPKGLDIHVGSDISLKGSDVSLIVSDIFPKGAATTPKASDISSPHSSSTLPQLLVTSPESFSEADIIPYTSSEVTQASLNSSPDSASTISIPPQSPPDLDMHELHSHISPGPSSTSEDPPGIFFHVGVEPATGQKMVTVSSMMMPKPQKPEVTIIKDLDEMSNSTDGIEERESEERQESEQLDDEQHEPPPESPPPTPSAITSKLDIPSISSREDDEGDNEEDEDSGVYDASYRHSDWIYVGNDQELQLMTKQIESGPNMALETVAEVNQTPTTDTDQPVFDRLDEARESVTTTTSEKEFRTQIQSLAYRRVHRKTSAIDYQRLSLIARERKVCVKKIDNMFGFRIQYSKPVVVTDIDKGGAAEHAGLRVGDMLLKVNEQDVRQCAHSQVVRLAMASPDPLNLVVGTNVCNTLNLYKEKPVMSGYLHKLGGTGMIRTWKKRWFVLKYDNCLYYYKTEEDVEPLGAIVLCNYTVMKARDVGKSYAFKLNKCKARTYYFYTSTEEEMSRWAKHITEAARPQNRSDIWLDISTHNVGLPALSIKNPDCQGFLNKMGAIRKNWKRRFCLLKDACLYYYKDMDAQHALGVAHFHGYSIQETEIGSKKFGLVLKPPSEDLRVFYFFADHETDRKRWVAAFATSIGRWIQTNNGDESDEESAEMLI